MAKKKKNMSIDPALIAGMGVAGGALVGTGLGVRRGNATKRRIPAAATRIANNSIGAFNMAEDRAKSYGRYERSADDKAYSGTTNSKDSAFYRGQARENRMLKEKNMGIAQGIEDSGRKIPSNNKKTIQRKLGRAPEVGRNRTKKYAKRGAAVGGAMALLASLVAKELSKGGSKKRG